MSTVPFPTSSGAPGPQLVRTRRNISEPQTQEKRLPNPLTIHRITRTHHGRTLLKLGHAAEYLADSRRFQPGEPNSGDAEAIHILMRLSRQIFDEFADSPKLHRRAERWLTQWVVGMLC